MSAQPTTIAPLAWDVLDARGQVVAISTEALEEGIDINSPLTLVIALQEAVWVSATRNISDNI